MMTPVLGSRKLCQGAAMRRSISLVAVLGSMLLLVSCESGKSPSKSNEQTGIQQPVATNQNSAETGRFAFQKTFIAARSWAQDAKPVNLESQVTKAFNGQSGKAGVWRA